jgi:hypothetical protein
VIDQVWQHIGNQKVHDDITLLILKQQWLVIGHWSLVICPLSLVEKLLHSVGGGFSDIRVNTKC